MKKNIKDHIRFALTISSSNNRYDRGESFNKIQGNYVKYCKIEGHNILRKGKFGENKEILIYK